MTVGKAGPGLVTIIGQQQLHQSIVELARFVATDLRTEPGTYSLHLCVPDKHIEDFSRSLVKFAGKTRACRFTPRSLFDSIHHIRSFGKTIPGGLRRRIADELSTLAQSNGITPMSSEQLDYLVGSNPTDPLAQAYVAAFEALGNNHPFSKIDEVSLAVSVRNIYVACFDDIPADVQRWILVQSDKGVNVTVVSACYIELHDRLVGEGVPAQLIKPKTRPSKAHALGEDWRRFETLSHERKAVLDACQSDEVDTVFCTSQESRRYIEVECLIAGAPCVVDSVVSVLNSLELRSIAAILDWELDESSSSVETLLEMAGIRRERWNKFAKSRGLPRSTQAALIQATTLPESDDWLTNQARSLGSMLVSLQFQPNTVSRLKHFIEWCAESIAGFDIDCAIAIVDQVFVAGSLDISTFRTNIWKAMDSDIVGAIRVFATFDESVGVCQNAWLSLEASPLDDLERTISTIKPVVARSLIVSHHI